MQDKSNTDNRPARQGRVARIRERVMQAWTYCSTGIWRDTRPLWWVNVIKTLNLSVRSFLSTDLQSTACAMTYRTVLAIVPALALLVGIGRGFGIQSYIQDELYKVFPSQKSAIDMAMGFVDSYLSSASEGLFVGVGVAFLLWTLISLVSSVEDSFNLVWGVKRGRSIWRKITDYTATLLILPVLMVCASGLTVFVTSTFRSLFDFEFMTPLITAAFEAASYVMTWLFFAAAYMLIPNTKVRFRNALVAGILAGSGFLLVQWLFMTGQLYVAKYNAIYGSFSFIPLMLLWIQLTWVITLAGALICCSSQNIFQYSFDNDIASISPRYMRSAVVAVATVIVQRFDRGEPPATVHDLEAWYGFPMRLVNESIDKLIAAGIVSRVVVKPGSDIYGYQPAASTSRLTLAVLLERLNAHGLHGFIPFFDANFEGVVAAMAEVDRTVSNASASTLISNLKVLPPEAIDERSANGYTSVNDHSSNQS